MKKTLFSLALLTVLGMFALHARPKAAASDESPTPAEMLQVVFHVNFADAEAQERGLENIGNIIKAVGPAATIEVVCHGPGIDLAVKERSKHAEQVESLISQRVRFVACANTMRKKSIDKEQLLDGVGIVPSGAVEVIRKQHEGYAYFKP